MSTVLALSLTRGWQVGTALDLGGISRSAQIVSVFRRSRANHEGDSARLHTSEPQASHHVFPLDSWVVHADLSSNLEIFADSSKVKQAKTSATSIANSDPMAAKDGLVNVLVFHHLLIVTVDVRMDEVDVVGRHDS